MSRAVLVLRVGRKLSLPVSRRALLWIPLLALLCALLAFWALGLGSAGGTDRLAVLGLREADATTALAAQLRLPRIGVALLAGAMLAASGMLLQVVSRNGLADPGLLGLSQGAVLAILAAQLWGGIAGGTLVWAGLAGALGTALAVLGLSRVIGGGSGLILVGVALNAVLGGVSELIATSGGIERFARVALWSHGSLAAADSGDLRMLAGWAGICLPLLLCFGPALGPLGLGDEAARSLGIATGRTVPGLVVLAAALAAPVVAACGPVAFLGLMSAWIARRLVGDGAQEVLWTAMLLGAGLLLAADTAGRVLFQPLSVAAGLLTAIGGVLIFLVAVGFDRRRLR